MSCTQFRAPQYKKHVKALQRAQRRLVKGLGDTPYEERPRALGLSEKQLHCSLQLPEGRKPRGRCQSDGRTHRNSTKLCQGKDRLSMRKSFLTVKY